MTYLPRVIEWKFSQREGDRFKGLHVRNTNLLQSQI